MKGIVNTFSGSCGILGGSYPFAEVGVRNRPTEQKVPTLLLGLTWAGRAIMFGPFSFVTFFPKYVESRDAPIQVTVVLECPITSVFVVL